MTAQRINDADLRRILSAAKTIACVGASANPLRPSYFVARYLSIKGYRVLPINPAYVGQSLFGEAFHATLNDVAGERVDMVDIFRRSDQVEAIVDQALTELRPTLKSVWMQFGVINETAASKARSAGLDVVMDRCPKLEHQRLFGDLRKAGFNTGIISSKL